MYMGSTLQQSHYNCVDIHSSVRICDRLLPPIREDQRMARSVPAKEFRDIGEFEGIITRDKIGMLCTPNLTINIFLKKENNNAPYGQKMQPL